LALISDVNNFKKNQAVAWFSKNKEKISPQQETYTRLCIGWERKQKTNEKPRRNPR
jgi:hypothetical protein